jgi:class I fructose-bisphosphate aldolase
MTPRVREILSWYGSDNPGTLSNLARLLNHGKLAGSGKLVILSVDHGLEQGPARSFAKNPDAYDPAYLFELAIESGCSAHAAPLGAIESCVRDFAGEIPLILKATTTAQVDDALRLGCSGISFTIRWSGSVQGNKMYEEIQEAARRAKQLGLVVFIGVHTKGESLNGKTGEPAVDVVADGAHIACQLGAHIVQVGVPVAVIEQEAAKYIYEAQGIRVKNLVERARHLVQSSFNGRRIILFSGGELKGTPEMFEEAKQLAQGGAFGTMMGRNALQRPRKEAVAFLHGVMEAYTGRGL